MISLTSILGFVAERPCSVDFIQSRCLRKRLNSNNCNNCLQSCDAGALSLLGRDVIFNKDLCRGCMVCTRVCPQDAFENEFDDYVMLAEVSHREKSVVTCNRKTGYTSEEISVPCLGLFSRHHLIALGLGGCRQIFFDFSHCSLCENHKSSEVFRDNLDAVKTALSEILVAEFFTYEASTKNPNAKLERREYLSTFSKKVANTSKRCFPLHHKRSKPRVSGKQQHRRVPAKIQIVRDMAMALDTNSQKRILSFLGITLSVNDDCDCCPQCKGMCPTGAISIERSEKGKILKHEGFKCSGCGLCIEFCKKNALSFDNSSL